MVAVGEAAELQVLLTLRDQLSPGLAQVNGRIAALSGASGLGGLSGVASKVESAFGKVGTALQHAGSQIGGLIKNIGLFGGAIGLFSAAGAIKGAIDTANNLAKAIEVLGPLTGDTAEQVSSLLAVFNKYGIDSDTATTRIAFMEKAVGLLTASTKTATAFQKEFGFSLTDASGKVKDANTLLLDAADYWNSDASATEKAALESKLFGRGFADLIPILNLGSQGIKDAEAAAQSLGLTLTAQNVTDLQNYQEGMRNLGEAMGGLELQISLALVPALTDLARNLTSFITTNKGQIIAFFQDAAKFAEQMGSVIEHDVVPAIKAIVGWWNSLPSQLKDFLITAFVAGKVSKFLFDVNIPGTLLQLGVKWAAQVIAGLAGDVLGFATGGAVAAGEIEAGMAAGGATAAGEIGAAEAGGGVVGGAEAAGGGALAGVGALGAGGIAAGAAGLAAIALATTGAIHTIENGISQFFGGGSLDYYKGTGSPFTGSTGQYATRTIPKGDNVSGGTGGNVGQDQYSSAAIAAQKLAIAAQAAASVIHDWSAELKAADKALKTIRDPKSAGVGAAADSLVTYFSGRSLGALGGIKNANDKISGDIKTLTADERAAAARGDTATANKLKSDIQALKDRLAALQAQANAKLTTIANKPTNFTAITTVNSVITTRSIDAASFRIKTYGNLVIS